MFVFFLGACATPVVKSPGPDIAKPQLQESVFIAADGNHLPFKSWLPAKGNPEAILIALHGFNDYSNFFTAPGMYLSERGIASYAYDQRGFGKSVDRGFWSGTGAMTDDLMAFTTLIAQRHPGTPLFLLGESMGGAVVMTTAAKRHLKDIHPAGIILSAPAVWGRETMPWYQTLALWFSAHAIPGVKLTGRGLNIQPSDNIEMLRALGRDPLVIKATRTDAIYGLTDLMDKALLSASQLSNVPALILYGKKDEIIPKEPTRLMLERMDKAASDSPRHKMIIYENGYHMLLRDLQADKVLDDIDHWIKTVSEKNPQARSNVSVILPPAQTN